MDSHTASSKWNKVCRRNFSIKWIVDVDEKKGLGFLLWCQLFFDQNFKSYDGAFSGAPFAQSNLVQLLKKIVYIFHPITYRLYADNMKFGFHHAGKLIFSILDSSMNLIKMNFGLT